LRAALATGAGLAVPTVIPISALGANERPTPSERITMGCIGLGGRGTVNVGTRTYANGVKMIVRSGGPNRFEGTEGSVELAGKTDPVCGKYLWQVPQIDQYKHEAQASEFSGWDSLACASCLY